MCYYSSISVGFKIIETRFGVKFVQTGLYRPVFSASAFTFPELPAVTDADPEKVTFLRWGLIPFWVKDAETALEIRHRGLNARSETVFERPLFRHAIVSKRCLVVADGFFEWRHINNQRYPYYIRLTDHSPFALAGVWESWKNRETGEEARTFAVITTPANHLLAQIHNTKQRMPVILRREDERKWLEGSLSKTEIASLFQPYDAGEMEAYPVSRSIHRLGFNTTTPVVQNPCVYKDLPALVRT